MCIEKFVLKLNSPEPQSYKNRKRKINFELNVIYMAKEASGINLRAANENLFNFVQ